MNELIPTNIERNDISAFFTDKDGKVFISSTYISIKTKKKHHNVMRDIRNIIDADKDFTEINFELCQYSSNRNNSYDFYWLTEDGFSVIMGGYSI